MGRQGAVATNHPLATQAGIDVLRIGGNAVDAAVAAAFAIGVVEPQMSGLGGDGFYHVLDGHSGASVVFNGSGAAPAAASVERFRGEPDGKVPQLGPLAISVPGAVAGLAAMHARYGSRPWPQLVGPAIGLAKGGFAATQNYRRFAASVCNGLAADARCKSLFLCGGDRPPALGTLVMQPDLARTLATIAAEGGEVFYRGALAQRLAAAVAAAGGLLAQADLAACRAERQKPIRVRYRGFEVRQTPPNSLGFSVLQALKMVERFDLASFGWSSADLVHHLVEARKRAFIDSERFAGDPRRAAIPLDRLLSGEHARAHAAAIDPLRAARHLAAATSDEGCTTYFCVVDRHGNAVSAIQSLCSPFGSAFVAGDTGVLMNNRMVNWHLDDGHANRLEPGKRVRHTMTAPVVLRDGKLWCVLGTPGADNQVMTLVQTLVGMIDFGFDPQRVLESPRWMFMPRRRRPGHPDDGVDLLAVERSIGGDVLTTLQERGHRVAAQLELAGTGSVSVIRILEQNGVRMAASDPRMDGWAAAY